jgi:hypothetical protein
MDTSTILKYGQFILSKPIQFYSRQNVPKH